MRILGWEGPEAAERMLEEAAATYQKKARWREGGGLRQLLE